MSITDPNSVLILGAGASKYFDLPLGGELIDLISSKLRSEIEEIRKSNSDFRSWYHSVHPTDGFNKARLMHTIQTGGRANGGNYSNAIILELLQRLEGQTAETIDTFIFRKP